MAFSTNPLGKPTPIEPEAPKIYSDHYQHELVQSSYQPEFNLLSQVSGTPSKVEYYRQRLGASEEPITFQPNDLSTYQSYLRIKDVIIMEEGDGSYEYDPQTGESAKNYNGWIMFDLTPIRGDVFITDIGDGNAGLFVIIDQPTIPNFTANKVYYLTYKMVAILTRNHYEELSKRVVEELVYSRDSVLNGGNAVISTETFDTEKQLMKWLVTICNYIMTEFYWNPEKTIAYDLNNEMVYDQYLVKFLANIMPGDLTNSYPWINTFSTQYGGRDYGFHGTINIWDVLMRKDFNLLPLCNNKAWTLDCSRLMNTRAYGNLRNSKFDKVIITDIDEYKKYKIYYNMDGFPLLTWGVETKITYLFSESFYKGVPTTPMESLIIDILRDDIIDRKKLLAYCNGYFNLERIDQLYHGAILILLLQASRKIGAFI